MNDIELADAIVALGIGCKSNRGHYAAMDWRRSNASEESIARLCHATAEHFVRDWHVVGALMEKLRERASEAELDGSGFFLRTLSDPRALVECLVDNLCTEDSGQ